MISSLVTRRGSGLTGKKRLGGRTPESRLLHHHQHQIRNNSQLLRKTIKQAAQVTKGLPAAPVWPQISVADCRATNPCFPPRNRTCRTASFPLADSVPNTIPGSLLSSASIEVATPPPKRKISHKQANQKRREEESKYYLPPLEYFVYTTPLTTRRVTRAATPNHQLFA